MATFEEFIGSGDDGKRKRSKEERRGSRSRDRATACGIGKLCPPPMGKKQGGKKVKYVDYKPKEEPKTDGTSSHTNPRYMGAASSGTQSTKSLLEKVKKQRQGATFE